MPSRFGERIREARKTSGLTLDALAKKVGCSRQLLSQVERGEVLDIQSRTLFAISAATKYNARWLVTGVGTRRILGPMPDDQMDLFITVQALPPAMRKHLLGIAESLAQAAAAEKSRAVPFAGVPPPNKR